MAEPEDIILDGAHHATLFVQGVWRRRLSVARPNTVLLADVRLRLEHFVRAAFGLSLSIGVAQPPPPPTWFSRLGRRIPRHLVERRTLAVTDGERLRLPREIRDDSSGGGAVTRYRMLAAQGAARAVRGTQAHLPADPITRDLYLIHEAGAADRMLESELPGLRPELRGARAAERAVRPRAALLTAQEYAVEEELLATLDGERHARMAGTAPAASFAWAVEMAARVRALDGPYRGLPVVALWGLVEPPAVRAQRQSGTALTDDQEPPIRRRVSRMLRRPKVRAPVDDEDDENVGLWMIQLDDPQEHVEDPMGLQRPTDRDDDVDPDTLADSLSELPEARLVVVPGRSREVLASDDPPPTGEVVPSRGAQHAGLVYPEWDFRTRTYHEHGAVIRVRVPTLGDAAWADAVLSRRAALLHEVRRRFERLRPHRHRLGRQLDGPEVDLAAYVAAYADRRAGLATDGRLYEATRATRRDVAIALLVDVSGSTDSWIMQDLRVIDVEKEALLVVCDALDALGDPYTIQAFSGEGPECVSVLPIKTFEDRSGSTVRRRIAALEPDRYTRMGAALRHTTVLLMARPARHRLLLVLSDGKPNDVDRYEGRYGVEDARQAVAEARLQGLHPFCVTVDRHAPAYMPRIFGAGGYAALQHPEHLPSVLVEVLRRLVRA
jgi:nitric oxide reductase NorD protein